MPSNKVHNLKQVEASSDTRFNMQPVDMELANGPFAKRSCTDMICCLLFLIFMGGMIGIAGYAISKGNPNLIGRGYDADGKMCGIDTGYEDYPYLYFAIPMPGYLNQTVCVKTCPITSTAGTVDCKSNNKYPSAPCPAKASSAIATDYVSNNLMGNLYTYMSVAYVDRLCLPIALSDASAATAVLNSDLLEKWVSDIRSTWQVMAASLGVAFVIGFIYMIFLRYCSGILTWAAILAFIAGTGVLGWRFYLQAQATEADMDAIKIVQPDADTDGLKQDALTQKIIAYICWGVAGFTILAVLCLWSRIRLAIAIIKAAADFIKDTPSVFVLPPLTIVFLVIFYAYWAGTSIFLISSGNATQLQGTAFGTFEFDKTLKRILIYHLFGLLWFNAFVLAAAQFIIASTTCLWYFSQGTGQAARKTIRTSMWRFFRYHFGSIAFGSLILAIIQMIRLILAYFQAQAKKLQGKDGKLVKFLLSCMQCYLACFEKCIKFLNKNAYIQIALTGKSFCPAAKDAFSLIIRNPLRMGIVTSLGGIFVLFGKVFIASLTALAGFLVITRYEKFSTQIYSPFIPTLFMFVFAYVIGACFMTVYGLAADTILACFILDEEINSKKNAPPRHCPPTLREFLNNHVKK